MSSCFLLSKRFYLNLGGGCQQLFSKSYSPPGESALAALLEEAHALLFEKPVKRLSES
jgi:hypothetical protein